MNPYPQKPNVTRTSRHEGSYSYEGMKREYKTKEELRKELEARWDAGELPTNMEPYLAWLQGKQGAKTQNTEFHEKLQTLICKLGKSNEELYILSGKHMSEEAFHNIRTGNFRQVSKSSAKNIYYKMKKLL